MPNVLDYLREHGGDTIAQRGFCEVDNLVMSLLSYAPIDNILHMFPMTVKETAENALHSDLPQPDEIKELLRLCAGSPRYGGMQLIYPRKITDTDEVAQFFAITVAAEDFSYMSFRGTDSTINGWKEDFNISFMQSIPSQTEAVRYMEDIAPSCTGAIIPGGHSKGGNLAVYGAMNTREGVKSRITAVYNNDGPGFNKAVLMRPSYIDIEKRIKTYLPQTSIIGMLLEHLGNYVIVNSDRRGIMQHDAFSWQVEGCAFETLDTITMGGQLINKTLRDWIEGMSFEQRRDFTNALFTVLESTGVNSIDEISGDWLRNALKMAKTVALMDSKARRILTETIIELLVRAKTNIKSKRAAEKSTGV